MRVVVDASVLLAVVMNRTEKKAASALAFRLHLYAYDAYLLQCSLEQKSPLLTMDSGLKQAAHACSLELWEVEEA